MFLNKRPTSAVASSLVVYFVIEKIWCEGIAAKIGYDSTTDLEKKKKKKKKSFPFKNSNR